MPARAVVLVEKLPLPVVAPPEHTTQEHTRTVGHKEGGKGGGRQREEGKGKGEGKGEGEGATDPAAHRGRR